MRPPFPGMDPWPEHSALWPAVPNRLIAAMADELSPRLVPKYFVGIEEWTLLIAPEEDLLTRPDLAVIEARPSGSGEGAGAWAAEAAGPGALQVEVPMAESVIEWFLAIRLAGRGRLVMVLEVFSPATKQTRSGRRLYLRKRRRVLDSRTSLVGRDRPAADRPADAPAPAAPDQRLPLPGQPRHAAASGRALRLRPAAADPHP
ncbi:MAG: DUF4058 family protein, partial [Isosphaeraceae bacterium]|nr:DUF4058 family protein [Isosphaeraceae bacterium]